ncbi:Bug family tripartite tricarboxylate transporter substrate binding protein [Candidimonas nitroreducens]|nr:tripartite tricarboxylate transporter substrate binding protein [Candidimonas nitroreducens]
MKKVWKWRLWAKVPSVLATGMLCMMAGAHLAAHAQAKPADYPSKTVRIVVPFPPGGSMDALARQIAQALSLSWNHPVVVENRDGASGIIGLSSVAKSAPDGYTLGVVANSFVANTLLRHDMPYDAFGSFEPVSLLASVPYVLVTNASLPSSSLSEFIAYAKSHPDTLNYASGGNGTMSHLGAEMLKDAIGIKAAHIPYRGQAPALTDTVSGQVSFTMGNLPEVISHTESGKVHALAIMSNTRSPLLPNTPTLSESGFEPLNVGSWYGLVAPHKTPQAVLDHIQKSISKVLDQASFRQKLEKQGFEVVGSTPSEFEAFMHHESAIYEKVIDSAKIKVQ